MNQLVPDSVRPTSNYLAGGDVSGTLPVIYWLAVCALLVFLMVLLGGATRLTHSGLSMVEWQPLLGILPPMDAIAWADVFSKYQLSPEYQLVNHGMSLEDFKTIFYFEYAHRLLGRLIGLVFVVPLIVFWVQGRLSRSMNLSLALCFFLGGLQGLLGWYMVQSGLVDVPQVSQYRLTAHLGLAVGLFGALLWILTGLLARTNPESFEMNSSLKLPVRWLTFLVFLMILLGGLVAGLKAGLIWNTFPLMGEVLVPDQAYSLSPFWLSALQDPTTVQLNHRLVAYTIFILGSVLMIYTVRTSTSGRHKVLIGAWYGCICMQIVLGVLTLIYRVPLVLAMLHQAGALVVFGYGVVLSRMSSAKNVRPRHVVERSGVTAVEPYSAENCVDQG